MNEERFSAVIYYGDSQTYKARTLMDAIEGLARFMTRDECLRARSVLDQRVDDIMTIPKLTDCVGTTLRVRFAYFRESHLYYKCENGLLFPVPISDVGTATMLDEDKSIFFMRWIRKHLETLREAVS